MQPALFSILECQPIVVFPTGYCAGPPFTDKEGVEQVLTSCGCSAKAILDVQTLWRSFYNPKVLLHCA